MKVLVTGETGHIRNHTCVELLNNDSKVIIIDNLINNKKNNISLKEKFKKYKGPNLTKDFKWDKPIGKEIL